MRHPASGRSAERVCIMNFHFAHVGDLHLGFPFKTCFPPEKAEYHKKQHFSAFERMIGGIIRAKVDFVVFAGDVFDRNFHCPESRIRFLDALERFRENGIRVWIAAGNHDPLTEWDDIADRIPDNVRLFGICAESEIIRINGIPAAEIAGASHADRKEIRNLALESVQKLHTDLYRIVLVHANVGTAQYAAPVTMEELKNSRVDYWALGHKHRREILLDDPLAVYCGSLYPLAKEENDRYGINLITVSEGRHSLELLPHQTEMSIELITRLIRSKKLYEKI